MAGTANSATTDQLERAREERARSTRDGEPHSGAEGRPVAKDGRSSSRRPHQHAVRQRQQKVERDGGDQWSRHRGDGARRVVMATRALIGEPCGCQGDHRHQGVDCNQGRKPDQTIRRQGAHPQTDETGHGPQHRQPESNRFHCRQPTADPYPDPDHGDHDRRHEHCGTEHDVMTPTRSGQAKL